MATLLLQLVGPMQSWGISSRFDNRDTTREPSKSGVVGMIAAAFGIPRDGDIGRIAKLRMSVRVDYEGEVKRDFQTAGGGIIEGRKYGVPKASGGIFGTVTSERFYLADAAFLVALEGEEGLLSEVDEALARPRWFLALGRRSYPPALPVRVRDGFHPGRSAMELFILQSRLKNPPNAPRDKRLRVVRELARGEKPSPYELLRYIPDQPISFAPPRHTLREVAVGLIELKEEITEELP